jgi:hypothetical protein
MIKRMEVLVDFPQVNFYSADNEEGLYKNFEKVWGPGVSVLGGRGGNAKRVI